MDTGTTGIDTYPRGVNKVRWHPGQEASLAPPCSKQVLWKQMYGIEGSTCDILGAFRRSMQSFGVPRSDLVNP